MPYAARATFVEFWALDRIAATARMARDRGGLTRRRPAEVDRFVADLLAGEVDVGTARSRRRACTATSGAATSCGAPTGRRG